MVDLPTGQSESVIFSAIEIFGISIIIFFKEINTFIQQRCIQLIKYISTVAKDFYFKYSFFNVMFIKES